MDKEASEKTCGKTVCIWMNGIIYGCTTDKSEERQ
ncbi:hypothetical protein HNO89_000988 [Sporosarcina luteola]|nr:hypothetical protein [Sporosarcina luteola]